MCQPFDSKSVKLRLDVEAMAAAADADIYTFGGAFPAAEFEASDSTAAVAASFV